MSRLRVVVPTAWLACALIQLSCLAEYQPSNPYDETSSPTLQAPARLYGVIYGQPAGADAMALEGAEVFLRDGPSESSVAVVTSSDGGFEFRDVVPGTYGVEVLHAGYVGTYRVTTLRPGDALEFSVTLEPRISGGEDTGRLHADIRLGTEMAKPEEARDHSGVIIEVEGTGIRSISNMAGEVDLFIEAGSHTIIIEAPEHQPVTLDDIVVTAGMEVRTELSEEPIVLDPNPGQISGRVCAESSVANAPCLAPNSTVLVSLLNTSVTGVTDESGNFLLTEVPPGEYTLVASLADHVSERRTLVVYSGLTRQLDETILLAIERGDILGRVVLEGGNPADLSGVTVGIRHTVYTGVSNVDGDFFLSGIPVGSGYELVATREEYTAASLSGVTISGGSVLDLSQSPLTLVKQAGNVTIADGSAYTNTRNVSLSLNAPDGTIALKVRGDLDASESDDFRSWTEGDSVTVLLADGDGSKAVSVQFRDTDGAESSVFSTSIVLDQTAPWAGSVLVNAGDVFSNHPDGQVSLTLAVVDELSGVATMLVSNSDSDLGLYTPYTQSVTHLVDAPSVDGVKTIYVRFRDRAGNVSVTYSDTITVDRVNPSLSTFSIDCGGETNSGVCNSGVIELAIDASDDQALHWMALSNDAGFPVEYFEPFQASRIWTLIPGDGSKTVYLKLKDAAGNVSDAFEDSIAIDTVAPSPVSLSLGSSQWTNSTTISVTLNAAGASKYYLAGDVEAGPTTMTWLPMTETVNVVLSGGDGPRIVTAKFADEAGNESDLAVDSITLDQVSPEGSAISAPGLIAGPTVALTLSAVDAREMEFTQGLVNANLIHLYSTQFDGELSGVDGWQTVSVVYRDAAGNESSPVSTTLYQDVTAPEIDSFDFAPSGGATNSTQVALELNASDEESGDDQTVVADYALFNSDPGDCSAATWLVYSGSSIYWDFAGGSVYACVRDSVGRTQGPVATASTKVLDTDPPSSARVIIDGDVSATTTVSLTLDAVGASEMIIGGDVEDDFATNDWVSYATTVDVTLSSGDGLKVVTVRFRDEALNESEAAHDYVILDTSAPENNAITITSGVSVSHSTTAIDTSGCTGNASWLGDGYCDATNNNSGCAWDGGDCCASTCEDGSYVCGSSSPYDCLDNGACESTGGVCWPGAGEFSFTKSESVTVALVSDGASEMQISTTPGDDFSTDSALWIPYVANATVLLPSGDCASNELDCKEIRVRYRDLAGNTSDVVSAKLTLDTVPPTSPQIVTTSEILGLEFADGKSDSQLTVNVAIFAPVSDSFFMEYQTVGGSVGSWQMASDTASAQSFSFTLRRDDSDEDGVTNSLRLRAIDYAGNVGPEASVMMTLDTNAPDAVTLDPTWTDNSDSYGKVFWQESASTDVVAHRIYYGLDEGDLTGQYATEGVSPVLVGPQNFAVLTGLVNASTTHVRVRPVDHAGNEGAEPLSSSTVRLQPNDVSPTLIAKVDLPIDQANRAMLLDDRLYIAGRQDSRETALVVVDTSFFETVVRHGAVNDSPITPSVLGMLTYDDSATSMYMTTQDRGPGLVIEAPYVFMTNGENLRIFEILSSSMPTLIATINFSGVRLTGALAQGPALFINSISTASEYTSTLWALDISSLYDGDSSTVPTTSDITGNHTTAYMQRVGGFSMTRDKLIQHPYYSGFTYSFDTTSAMSGTSFDADNEIGYGYGVGAGAIDLQNHPVSGNRLYMGTGGSFSVYDLSSLWSDTALTGYGASDSLEVSLAVDSVGDFEIQGSQAVVTDAASKGMRILDLNRLHVPEIGVSAFLDLGEKPVATVMDGNFVYALVQRSGSTTDQLWVYEIATPRAPRIEVARTFIGQTHQLQGGFVYSSYGSSYDLQAGTTLPESSPDEHFSDAFGFTIFEDSHVFAEGSVVRVVDADENSDRDDTTVVNEVGDSYTLGVSDGEIRDVDRYGSYLIATHLRDDGVYLEVFNALSLRDGDASTQLSNAESLGIHKVFSTSANTGTIETDVYRGRVCVSVREPLSDDESSPESGGIHLVDLRPLLDADSSTSMSESHNQGYVYLTRTGFPTDSMGSIECVLKDERAYVGNHSGVVIVDVTEAMDEDVATSVSTDAQLSYLAYYYAEAISVHGPYLFVMPAGTMTRGFGVYDVSDPDSPDLVATSNFSTSYSILGGYSSPSGWVPGEPTQSSITVRGSKVYYSYHAGLGVVELE